MGFDLQILGRCGRLNRRRSGKRGWEEKPSACTSWNARHCASNRAAQKSRTAREPSRISENAVGRHARRRPVSFSSNVKWVLNFMVFAFSSPEI
jgi:hypothetical protein